MRDVRGGEERRERREGVEPSVGVPEAGELGVAREGARADMCGESGDEARGVAHDEAVEMREVEEGVEGDKC